MEFEKINFVCHSLGAYFAILYAKKYSHRVANIFTMSAPMLTDFPEGFSVRKLNLPAKRKFIYVFWSFMNRRFIHGFKCFSMLPLRWSLKMWMKGRNNFPAESKEAIVEYMALQFWDPHFSGDIVTELCGYLSFTKHFPLIKEMDFLREKGIPVKFVFGEKDWIDYRHFEKESGI